MSFILRHPDGFTLSTSGRSAVWMPDEFTERTDYAFAIVFPSRESAEDACAARGEGATVEPLPGDL